MGEDNLVEYGLAEQGESALRPWLVEQAAGLREITPDEVVAALGGLLSDVDRAALTGAAAEWLAADFRRSVEVSPDGWLDDDLAFVQPWGFDVADVAVPTAVWQGHQDLMVPPTHGEWLAAHVPGVVAHVQPEHGHLSLAFAYLPTILAELASL